MRIVIPTRGRVDRQITWRALPPAWRPRTVVFCPPGERTQLAHFSRIPEDQLVVLDGITSIAQKRQAILEYAARTWPTEGMFMLDDDLEFHAREDPHNFQATSLRRSFASPERVSAAFAWLADLLDNCQVLHAALGPRQMNQSKDAVESPGRANFAFGCHPAEVCALGVRFDTMPLREDFHFTLQLLQQGYPNLLLHDVAVSPKDFGAAGGCSDERTIEGSNAAADLLAAAWPGLVRTTEKAYSASIPRREVVISWQKALAGVSPEYRASLVRAAHARYLSIVRDTCG